MRKFLSIFFLIAYASELLALVPAAAIGVKCNGERCNMMLNKGCCSNKTEKPVSKCCSGKSIHFREVALQVNNSEKKVTLREGYSIRNHSRGLLNNEAAIIDYAHYFNKFHRTHTIYLFNSVFRI